MNAFDWPALVRAGFQQLRLRPEEFWRLTPVEFMVLLGRSGAAAPIARDALERLASAFPDERKTR